jgi:transposase
MDRYIGLDAHSQTCTAAVMGPSGRRLQEQVLETNGKVLVSFLKSIAGDRYLCFEEGGLSEWLYETLEPYTKETLVVQAPGHEGPKDDSGDAWNLANEYRTGHLQKVVFKAPKVFTALRQAVRAHQSATQDLVRAKVRLKAVFRSRGVLVDDSVYQPGGRPKWLRRLPGAYRKLAELRAAQLDMVAEIHEQAEAWLTEEAAKIDAVKRLLTVPGIGTVRAAQIVAIVVTPNRFRTKRQFRNYCGFGVVTRSSSDYVRGPQGHWKHQPVQQTRGLNHNRNATLKAVFTGAAMTVIQQMKGHPLHQDYDRLLAANVKPPLARLTLARRIAGATLAIWKNKENYDPAKHESPRPTP